DRSPAQPVEFGGESVRGGGRQYGDDLELLGPGIVDDLRSAGDLGEHRLLRGAAGDGGVAEVEECDDRGRYGGDDLGLAQRGELTGGLAQGRPRSFAHGGDDLEQVRFGFGAFPGLAGNGVEDREHGPVDGAGNGGPGPVRGGLEGGGHGIGGGHGDPGQGVGDSLEGHGEDEPGVAAGPSTGSVGQRPDDLRQGDGTGELLDGQIGRPQSVVHVRAGVAVGHGEDIEFVDLGPLPAQPVDRSASPAGGQTTVEADGVTHVTSRNG